MNVALCPQSPTQNILSLCAGVGGLELGIQLALDAIGEAGRGICYVEREAAAAASLVASMEAGWFHSAPVWSDMLTFDARPWRGLVHILASGDPCQDNSVAGKRAGSEGERFLAAEVCRLAAECGPDLVFRENVPGNADGQLAAIVPALEGLGYRVAAGIFSSAETGNTMRRERLFIMAKRAGGGLRKCGAQAWPGCFGHSDGRGTGRDGKLAVTSDDHGRSGERAAEAGTWTRGERGGDLQAAAQQWASPLAQNHKGSGTAIHRPDNGNLRDDMLHFQAEQFFVLPSSPGPKTADGAMSSTATPNSNQPSAKRKLNPIFVEALMRWPTGLSGFERQETAWTQWWQLQRSFLSALDWESSDEMQHDLFD